MTTLVERNGAFALKMFAGGNAPLAELVLALTAKLRLAGVPVPETSKDSSTGGLRQLWIEGPTLKESMGGMGPVQRANDFVRHRRSIHGVMAALAKLHRAGTCTGGLLRFDPFRLIDRRLDTFPLGSISPDNRRRAREIRDWLRKHLTDFSTTGLIHGDLHAGQVIQDKATGVWWLIDLDDVSLGPPEADIGNFCAHIASTPAINGAHLRDAFNVMAALCIAEYDGALETSTIEMFGAAALTRRALKCAERHGPDARVTEMLMAARLLQKQSTGTGAR